MYIDISSLFGTRRTDFKGFLVLHEPTSVIYARTHRDAEAPQAGQLCSSMTVFELNSESEANSLSA